MASTSLDALSRREREVIQIIYTIGEGSAKDIQEKLPRGTKNSATRKILTALLKKGVVERRRDGRRYLYSPTSPANTAGPSALRQVVETYFQGSLANGLLGMVQLDKDRFTDEELEQIRKIVEDKS